VTARTGIGPLSPNRRTTHETVLGDSVAGDPPATLQVRGVEAIADSLAAKVIKQGPMDHAKCIEFWGSEVEARNQFPK
jgi:hypothetical protein